jgi:O-antigen/teichoic acid export membrane protein
LILRQGVYGAIMAAAIAYVILFFATLVYVFKRYGFHFSSRWFKKILKYGFPLIGTSVSVWILQSTDRYFLTHFAGLSNVGIYAVGIKLAGLLGMISGTLQFAWGPFAADIQYEPTARQIYAKVFEIFFIINILAIFMISMFSIDILKAFTQPAYYSAKAVVPFLCMSSVLWSGYFLAASGIMLAKKLIHTIWITLGAAAVNVGLNFVFTPVWGVVGAAFSLMISYFVNLVAIIMISQKFYPIPYRFSKIFYVLIPTTLIVAVSYYFGLTIIPRIGISVLFAAYFTYFIIKNYRHTEEFQNIVDALKRMKNKKEKPRDDDEPGPSISKLEGPF